MSEAYEAVIGLEIHIQLATETKMFCGCRLSFGDEPNVHTCPVCLGHPGALPVTNEKAVEYAIQVGLALGCEIAPRSIFHRKNYFYPDLPKGYQISQYDIPIASGGRLGDVRIHRAHLEEDAAKSIHVGESGRIHGSGASLVDFNRGGTPLIEIVTEPDIHDAASARQWLMLLRSTIKQLGVSDVNMEEGSLRCDANISIRPAGSTELGTKTELKNMNSFRFIERGIEAELARQRAIVEAGGRVEQETLHFDPRTGALTPLRSKEEAHDYRYFPEPDLVPIAVSEEMIEKARAALPELPAERAERYRSELDIPEETAVLMANSPQWAEFFERTSAAAGATVGGELEPRVVANWVTGELAATLRQVDPEAEDDPASGKVTPEALAELIGMVQSKAVSRAGGKTVLAALAEEGGEPAAIVEREGLAQIGDSDELARIVEAAMAANADAVEQVRGGNEKAIGAIVGAVMRETRGRADGGEVNRLIRERL
jgi:aspartyl-tRNA(Asn)/glutamyl-tRNA(Gln) amidotransferase subunit B